MKCKPGEAIHELVIGILQDAIAFDFQSKKDPLDESLRLKFICSMGIKKILKACFSLKEDELTFAPDKIALDIGEVAMVALKETILEYTCMPV